MTEPWHIHWQDPDVDADIGSDGDIFQRCDDVRCLSNAFNGKQTERIIVFGQTLVSGELIRTIAEYRRMLEAVIV